MWVHSRYAAIRTLAHCAFESLPQVAVQIRMASIANDGDAGGGGGGGTGLLDPANAGTVRVHALVAGALNIAFVAARTAWEVRRRRVRPRDYFRMLFRIGGGAVGRLAKRVAANDPKLPRVLDLSFCGVTDAHAEVPVREGFV